MLPGVALKRLCLPSTAQPTCLTWPAGGKPVICFFPPPDATGPVHASVRLGLTREWELSALVPAPTAASADGRSATWEVEVQPGGSVVVGAEAGSGGASSSGREWAYLFWEALTVAGAHVAAPHAAAGGSGGAALLTLPLALGLAGGGSAGPGEASPPWRPPVAGLPLPDFEPAHSFVVPRAGAQEWLHDALVGGFGMPVREATDMITYWCGCARSCARVAMVRESLANALHVTPYTNVL
jgi:hypothetical protein